jgi:hypothetical protein
MTLPTGTISMSQVNTELGLSATTTISLNQANVRALAGVPSGTISMNNLRGKSAGFTTFDWVYSGGPVSFFGYSDNYSSAGITFEFLANGQITGSSGSQPTTNPIAYGSPLTAGAGSGYQIRLNISYVFIGGEAGITINSVTYQSPTTTPYYSLGIGGNLVSFYAIGYGVNAVMLTNGTVEIRQISSGATITRPFNVQLYASD